MPKYSKGAQKKVEKVMQEKKHGTLRSGRSGKKVTSRKQAIAIGLSEARKEGAKVPKKSIQNKQKLYNQAIGIQRVFFGPTGFFRRATRLLFYFIKNKCLIL